LVSTGIKDSLYGGAGDDVVVLKGDKAFVNGGAGSDTFVFHTASDEIVIKGFEPGQDVLKLTSLLGDLEGWRDSRADDLAFIGSDDFHGNAFEIRYDIRNGGTETLLQVNLGGEEHTIATLQGTVRLDASDLIF
jgi:serralysin